MSLQIKGTVKKVLNKFEKGNFKTTPVHFETEGQYPQIVLLDFIGEKADEGQKLKIGDVLTVYFNLKGNVSDDKVYNKLQVWKWTKESI